MTFPLKIDTSRDPVRALVIGDPHFKVANVRETDAMVEAIIITAITRQPDIIVVLGDILDRHETIHVSPLTRATKFLGRLMGIAPTFVLIGNHDLKNNRQFLSDEHPFNALKFWDLSNAEIKRMTVVDTTTLVNIKGQIFVFVPYVAPGRFEEALNVCPGWKSATCIFGHQEFKGAQMGAIISAEGDEWPLTNPYVVTGHIHDYQEPQVNILYTGTPIQHAFGDRHDKTISYFTYYSTTERDHERIDLGLPRKQIVKITCAEVSTYVPQQNCELKIIIRGTSGEIKAIMKHPNIDLWKRAGYKILYKDIPLDKSDQSNEEVKTLVSRAPLRFSTVLYNTISTNERLGALYTRIFGSIRTTPDNGLILRIEPVINAMSLFHISSIGSKESSDHKTTGVPVTTLNISDQTNGNKNITGTGCNTTVPMTIVPTPQRLQPIVPATNQIPKPLIIANVPISVPSSVSNNLIFNSSTTGKGSVMFPFGSSKTEVN